MKPIMKKDSNTKSEVNQDSQDHKENRSFSMNTRPTFYESVYEN